MNRSLKLVCAAVLSCVSSAMAAWAPVPPMDWTGIQPGGFADHELEVPYHLEHFHRLANAVVEEGEHRGFLALKVNRAPKDNEPYNARILENHLSLAYFYAVKRDWNPYYGSAAVRVRLEAMLDFWCRSQNERGLFSEYSPTNFSLAPTGFGVRHMAETLDLLMAEGAPAFDREVLERTMAHQRKGIMALLTDPEMTRHARDWSNQWTGVYRAAAGYLRLREDAEMRRALVEATRRITTETQSPTGFLYEHGGPDFGYTHVHRNNLRLAAPLLGMVPEVKGMLVEESRRYARWLGNNLVLEPGGGGYMVNAGINTRTSHAFEGFASLPLAQEAEEARAFAMTQDEWAEQTARKRERLEAAWPKFKELVVPSAYSYQTGWASDALGNLDTVFPTEAERAAAQAKLPYLARTAYVRQLVDPRSFVFTYVRTPGYYAALNSGKIRVPGHQVYGLGLLWHPEAGTFMQSVAASPWQWGTRLGDETAVAESKDVLATITVGGRQVTGKPGQTDWPGGVVVASYGLPGGGSKQVEMGQEGIRVAVERAGEMAEVLPLIRESNRPVEVEGGVVRVRRGAATLRVDFGEGARPEVVEERAVGVVGAGALTRVLVRVPGRDRLAYTMRWE